MYNSETLFQCAEFSILLLLNGVVEIGDTMLT